MKKIATLFSLFTIFSLCSCSTPKEIKEQGSLVNDTSFINGFNVKKSKYSKQYDKKLNVHFNPNKKESTTWNISQWNRADAYDLTSNYTFTTLEDGSYEYKNEARTLRFNNERKEYFISLDTSLEYISDYGRPYLEKEGEWSHFLLDTYFTKRYLNTYDDGFVSFDFTLNECKYKGLNTIDKKGFHGASQIFMYLRVIGTTTNKQERMMWVGIPLYDARYTSTIPYISADSGHVGSTDDLIYSVSSSEIIPQSKFTGLILNNTYHVNVNYTNLIKRAYEYAKTLPDGKCCWKDVSYESMYVLYFNYGFEMPGAYKMSATMANLEFKYVIFELLAT